MQWSPMELTRHVRTYRFGERLMGSVFVSYVPELEREILTPLREAGYTDEQITALGEVFTDD